MNEALRRDGETVIRAALRAVLPDEAVRRALSEHIFPSGKIVLIATGKAAWQMASTACELLGDRISKGVVLTKYGHLKGPIGDLVLCEGGHPLPDANSFAGTEQALSLVRDLGPEDTVLFLLSGGGSALFEKPLVPDAELRDITNQLLACGADIVEMNTVRKRLSAVKGGRFAQFCAPAQVFSVILSDILGDPIDMIASGPTAPDHSTCADARMVAQKYGLCLSPQAAALLEKETPKTLENVKNIVTGSVRDLCRAARDTCIELGYETSVLTDCLCCEAREAGSFLASIARTHQATSRSLAFIVGGETVVHLTGKGKGGRNQEVALAAAAGIAGLSDTLVFSVGSDGTDGPTDAAGGIVDNGTHAALAALGIDESEVLARNDAYTALAQVSGLIMTGPTGTNVNDFAAILICR